jgi:phage baseplate assembly protein W
MTVVRTGGLIDWSLLGTDRIAQNVQNLLNTYRYEIPFHRTMGLPGSLIDRPINVQEAEARVEISQMISMYEPRANVKDIRFSIGGDGSVVTEVVLE